MPRLSPAAPSNVSSIGIACPFEKVYAFASNPENLPRWAQGLGAAVVRDGDQWLVQTPRGQARLRFAPPNPFGVLDHYVSPAPFTLFRQPGMPEERLYAGSKAQEPSSQRFNVSARRTTPSE